MARSTTVTVTAEKMPLIITALSINVEPTSGMVPLAVTITCRLTRPDTGENISGEPVTLYVNEVAVQTKITGQDPPLPGYVIFNIILEKEGSYSIYADYPGSTVYAGCG